MVISCSKQGIGLGSGGIQIGGGVAVGCKIQPVDGYVSVCLVLTIDVHARVYVP